MSIWYNSLIPINGKPIFIKAGLWRYKCNKQPPRQDFFKVFNFRGLQKTEGLPGVLGDKGTLAKYRREQGNISQFLGTGEQNSKNYSTKTF